MESLKLTFPSYQSGQEFITETEPKAVKSWLERLAFVETSQTLHELTRVITTLNRCDQKSSDREKNMSILNKGYLTLSRHMREQHDRHKAFIDKGQYKALHLLSTEMAFGYKRLIDDLTQQKFLLRKRRLANAINYAQHYLGLMLIEQYQLYKPIPSYIWRELHSLYEYAEKVDISNIKLDKSNPYPLEPCTSIRQTYIRNCLMSVIDPYHIEDNQHWHLFKYLTHWADLVEVTDNLKQYSNTRCFIIDLTDSDKPHIATDDSEYDNEQQIRLLLTHKLLENIQSQLHTFETKQTLPSPGFYAGIEPANAIKLLNRIYEYCDTYKEREYSRYPLMTQVDAIWGLSEIKKALAIEKEHNVHMAESNYSELMKEEYAIPFNWLAVNHSDGGICIQNHLKNIENLHIGHLVMLKRYINKKPQKSWQLGIVRWLQTGTQSGSSVGIEYIHGDLNFIEYLTTNKQGNTISHEVLLVKPFDQSGSILITAKNLIGGHKKIQVQVNKEVKELTLTHLIETNSKISAFGVNLSV